MILTIPLDYSARVTNRRLRQQGQEGIGPRYAVYDFEYSLSSGEGDRYVSCTPAARIQVTLELTMLQKQADLHCLVS